MRSKSPIVLSGPVNDVRTLLTAANYGPRLLRVTASDDGETVTADILPAGQTEFQLSGSVPQPSVVISAPDTRIALVVESANMSELAAVAATSTIGLSAYDANGFVIGSSHRDSFMPTPVDTYDRAVLRNLDTGMKIADVEIPNLDSNARFTAAFASENGPSRAIGITAFGVIGGDKVYAIDPTKLDASGSYKLDDASATELPNPIVRASRNDVTGNAEFILSDGNTAAFRSEDGQLVLASLTASDADEIPDAQGWQAIGNTAAIENGRGYVQPGADNVAYRFEASAIEVGPA